MIVSLIALASGTITFENPGIRLELFLKEISKQTGETFRCPVPLKDEVLAASFKDQSIDIVRSQLARVIHGTWEKRDDGWWLVQTLEQKQQEQLWHREMRRTLIQDLINGSKPYAPKHEWTAQDADSYARLVKTVNQTNAEHIVTTSERRHIRALAPTNRFLASLFSQLKPEQFPLDSLEPDYQLYTVNCDGFGVKLPLDLTTNFSTLDRELSMYAQANNGTVNTLRGERVTFNLQNSVPLRAVARIYDQSWKFVISGNPSSWAPIYKADGESFPLSKQLEETYLDFENMQKPDDDDDAVERMSVKLRPIWMRNNQVFADAVNRDPLGLMQGACWVDFSHHVGRPMLVNLAESLAVYEPRTFVPKSRQDHTILYTQRDDVDGWIVGRPVDPLWNRTHRMDREDIRQYVQLMQIAPSQLTVENQAIASDIAYHGDTFCSGIPNDRLLHLQSPNSEELPVPLYGAALRSGIHPNVNTGVINLRQLPSYAQGYLQLAYVQGSLNQLATDEATSPAKALPNGTQGIYLRVSTTYEPVFRMRDSQNRTEDFSLWLFATAIADQVEKNTNLNMLTFELGSVRQLEIALCLGDKTIKSTLDDPPSGKYVKSSWNTLPPEVKKQVLDKIKEVRDPDPPTSNRK